MTANLLLDPEDFPCENSSTFDHQPPISTMTLPPLALDMIIGLGILTALYVLAGWVADAIDRGREP